MSQFFKNFEVVPYYFGNEITQSLFQNLGTYISIIDEIKDDTISYNSVFIEEGDRPDSLSYKLYGTIDYYWTFYFLNNDLRESGWPLSYLDLENKAKLDYPNYTVTTAADITSRFKEGDSVVGLNSGASGTVVKRYLDLGQIVIDFPNHFDNGEQIRANNIISDQVIITSSVVQYNSVHHYENTSGEWVDVNPYNLNTSGLIPITYFDRILAKNDSLKEIKVFKPQIPAEVQSEFQKLLLRGY